MCFGVSGATILIFFALGGDCGLCFLSFDWLFLAGTVPFVLSFLVDLTSAGGFPGTNSWALMAGSHPNSSSVRLPSNLTCTQKTSLHSAVRTLPKMRRPLLW